uniref:Uncharacterized protein n=1 Tax=Nelumbo nucifera TaxID=4432 RepID=A0A822ZYG5_NELNU|nr:TPA_asm: hypothetical protein HUJ06_017823 [Nelumbo nucifera]
MSIIVSALAPSIQRENEDDEPYPDSITRVLHPCTCLSSKNMSRGMEATLFAIPMSISNGDSSIGGLICSGLMQLFGVTKDNFDNLAMLILMVLYNIRYLIVLGLVPRDNLIAMSKRYVDVAQMKSS